MVNTAAKKIINKITYRELMIIYGLTAQGAIARLQTIRAAVGITPARILNVFAFCKAEGITIEDFDLLYQRGCTPTKEIVTL